jgi:hypothetical protein
MTGANIFFWALRPSTRSFWSRRLQVAREARTGWLVSPHRRIRWERMRGGHITEALRRALHTRPLNGQGLLQQLRGLGELAVAVHGLPPLSEFAASKKSGGAPFFFSSKNGNTINKTAALRIVAPSATAKRSMFFVLSAPHREEVDVFRFVRLLRPRRSSGGFFGRVDEFPPKKKSSLGRCSI